MPKHKREGNVVELEIPDETIVQDTLIPIADADPAIIARRLRRLSWPRRLRFFSNIVVESFQRFTYLAEAIEDDDAKMIYKHWFLISCLRAIGRSLENLSVDRPETDLAAVLFALSGNPEHRKAASLHWRGRHNDYRTAFYEAARGYDGLLVLYNSVMLLWPGIGTKGSMDESNDVNPGHIPRLYSPKQTWTEWCATVDPSEEG